MALYSTTSGCAFVEKQWGSRVDLRWFSKSFPKFSGSGSANSPVQLCLSETEYSPIALLLYLWVVILHIFLQFKISHNLIESTMDFMTIFGWDARDGFLYPSLNENWRLKNPEQSRISDLCHEVIVIISIFYGIWIQNWCWHSSVQIEDCLRHICRQTLQPR